MDLYIDCEWIPATGRIFLIGYAYDLNSFNYLADTAVNAKNMLKVLSKVNPQHDFIFVFGPDIGWIEKRLNMDIRKNWNCINLLTLCKRFAPKLKSYRLEDLEYRYNIQRSTHQYKANIWYLVDDWKNPIKREKVIQYNKEDVLNLIRFKNAFFKERKIKKQDLFNNLLAGIPTKQITDIIETILDTRTDPTKLVTKIPIHCDYLFE